MSRKIFLSVVFSFGYSCEFDFAGGIEIREIDQRQVHGRRVPRDKPTTALQYFGTLQD